VQDCPKSAEAALEQALARQVDEVGPQESREELQELLSTDIVLLLDACREGNCAPLTSSLKVSDKATPTLLTSLDGLLTNSGT
jgi:hypothetical protein